MKLKTILLTGGAVAYLLLPIDLVPDFIPVVGFLDDLGAGLLALYFARK